MNLALDIPAASAEPEIVLLRPDPHVGLDEIYEHAAAARAPFAVVHPLDVAADPRTYRRALIPLLDGNADVVFARALSKPGLAERALSTVARWVAGVPAQRPFGGVFAFRTDLFTLLRPLPGSASAGCADVELWLHGASGGARMVEVFAPLEGRPLSRGAVIARLKTLVGAC